ncbi:hypothetical protein DESA109040_22945 [Deinococcus saxicola]|uniref:hypothetical protein n=2 Tax=Deinococcus saxicola TaxID=249406 RepID=UPI0039F019D9
MKRLILNIGMASTALLLYGCGQQSSNQDAPLGKEPSSLLTAQTFIGCSLTTTGAASGYSTYITYNSDSLRVCRIATPGPYDYQPGTSYPGNQPPATDPAYGYMIFAKMGTDTSVSKVANVRHSWSLSETTGPNPLMNKEAVGGWFNNSPYTNTKIVLNGQFFDCTESCLTAHSSFPIFYANDYITIGNNAQIDDKWAKRALCFDSSGGRAAYKTWTLNSTNSSYTNIRGCLKPMG